MVKLRGAAGRGDATQLGASGGPGVLGGGSRLVRRPFGPSLHVDRREELAEVEWYLKSRDEIER